MLLCDIGNTSYHFFDGKDSYKKSVKTFDASKIEGEVYYISVNSQVNRHLKNLKNWIDLSEHIDKSIYYETMGIDRIVAVNALSNGVIVDAGSAITVDVVRDTLFDGGFITPGLEAMRETYKRISPALDYEFNISLDTKHLPKNSQDAISYGYLKTLYSEVMSHKLPIVLTGGDAKKLYALFPDATVDKYLIFKGMKKILIKL